MTRYLDRIIAERTQRLARMGIPRDSLAGARFLVPAGQTPDRPSPAPTEETGSILSRIEAIERALAAGVRPVDSGPRPHVQVSEIKAVVCRYYGLTPADLAQRPRPRDISRVRQIAIYLARQLTGKSFRALAQAFGDRTHPSVIRAFRTVERLRLAKAETDSDLQALAGELGSVLRPNASTRGAETR
jgi:hypothetical protein